ncbi:hypothetical protein chiPu_0028057, partial [Chiloscyllium punctatum]|nr:hypothetical protein [Chiloscyllium punctatum]
MENRADSNIVMISNWAGLVFPSRAPNEIKTDPVQKSALIMLEEHTAQVVSQSPDPEPTRTPDGVEGAP